MVTQPSRARTGKARRDPNALVGAAAVLTGARSTPVKLTVEQWQTAAWDYYDRIGELRFGVNWKANAMSRVNLVAAIPPARQGDEPTVIDLSQEGMGQYRRAVELVEQIAGGPSGQGQLLAGVARQLSVPGIGYILAQADEETDEYTTWRVLSNDEARKKGQRQDGSLVLEVTDPESGEWVELGESDLLVKVWNAHPRRSWEPDSPVRAVLSALKEIDLMTKRIAADAESRLLGAGLLIMPDSLEFPPGQQEGQSGEGGADQFIETFYKVAQLAIDNRESPAARMPLVVKVPEAVVEHAGKLIHFWSEFDANLDPLRTAAIKRLALGLDMPPEVLLGQADSNHWTAWQVQEDAITIHIEPLAETACHALTIGYLQAALEVEGIEPSSVMVWYDTSDLRTRPDRSEQASEAHARIKISDSAYLRELGLSDDDKPDEAEERKRLLLKVAEGAPTLAPAMLAAVGILPPVVAEAAADAEAGAPSAPVDEPTSTPAADGPPADGPTPPSATEAAALLAAADGLVVRALERAGQRLRAAAGKGRPGGAESIACDDPTTLHTQMSATEFASLDHLLAGAWDRCVFLAVRHGVDRESLVAALDAYTRALLAAGHAHDYDTLAIALGVTSQVDRDAGHVIAAH